MERVHLWSLIGAVIVHPRVLSAGVFLILYLHLVFYVVRRGPGHRRPRLGRSSSRE
ncbi:hypothetical protein TPADAL_0608a [Treponema pallidum subsp. pallidum DAL-1]|uniref:Uncharacterized protein n=2 Tax=Treponema pallidum TaxID=160 RepID=A0AAU8S1F2_TREPL|nr:hypothetical protein TPESAMD_0608a [Treponema pallidum subsp. pertenue str. SamoaD]AEZ58801.1 hypothetical protein TPECDC2_0608a [Treponema pallidum subsp. pertenue str. CDC2]AEZ59869.1 hypothetical protein TPEGAU_0608a [Treponema pallidum subsp. pertenue str. Gauthier]AEZ60930.1 hypothetical protein TPADAL_0608a [Treponema pallidum subsp. pallidum DAL-1]AGK84253.1 hypothetical protein TPFB_0608a [Treponema pallidum str. Fribourg-Blanc]AJB40629.1 hypothetical protein TENDBA_0608a [Treponema